jgi:hypothetical protein
LISIIGPDTLATHRNASFNEGFASGGKQAWATFEHRSAQQRKRNAAARAVEGTLAAFACGIML